MDQERFQAYMKNRYENQINWYNNSALKNKRFYNFFQWNVIIFSASLPVLIVSLPDQWKWVTVILSILLAVCTAGLTTFKFKEHWINYRIICEKLKKEKYYYDAMIGEYANALNKENLFVERVETILSSEGDLWTIIHIQKEKGEKNRQCKIDTPSRN